MDERGPEPEPLDALGSRLARMFPDVFEALDVVRQARVDLTDIPAVEQADEVPPFWQQVVREAAAQGRLSALVGVARQRFGRDRVVPFRVPPPDGRSLLWPLLFACFVLGAVVSIAAYALDRDGAGAGAEPAVPPPAAVSPAADTPAPAADADLSLVLGR